VASYSFQHFEIFSQVITLDPQGLLPTWTLPFDLSGLGDSRGHWDTQASTSLQDGSSSGGGGGRECLHVDYYSEICLYRPRRTTKTLKCIKHVTDLLTSEQSRSCLGYTETNVQLFTSFLIV
jgi:hypothetical protein